jgi:hypothetical protein
MGKKQARRGKKAESDLAEKLTAMTGVKFVRTPGSGSGHTWKFFGNAPEELHGDVVPQDPAIRKLLLIVIESKKTTSNIIQLDTLLFGDRIPATLEKWILKVQNDAEKAGNYYWALVMSRNQGPHIVVMSKPNVTYIFGGESIRYVTVNADRTFVCMSLSEFGRFLRKFHDFQFAKGGKVG